MPVANEGIEPHHAGSRKSNVASSTWHDWMPRLFRRTAAVPHHAFTETLPPMTRSDRSRVLMTGLSGRFSTTSDGGRMNLKLQGRAASVRRRDDGRIISLND
jgi:hypothetical protein